MKAAGRCLPLLLVWSACACAHFRAAWEAPRLRRPLERGAYGFELGSSLRQIDSAAERRSLADHEGRFNRREPVAIRSYDVDRGTAAHVTVTLMDGRAEGIMIAFSSAAPSFDSIAADLAQRYGPPQLDDDSAAPPDRYRDLYWSNGWTVLRLSQRRIDRFAERAMELVEIPRLGKIGFPRFSLDKKVVFGPKGFAVRDLQMSTAAVVGCGPAAEASKASDNRAQRARQSVYAGDFAQALERADSIIQDGMQDGEEADAWQTRAAALFQMGRKDAARDSWRRAYELDPCLVEIPAFLKSQGY